MRIRDPFSDGEEPYNLVPLTDMVFNLLIFFMCATTFVQVEKEMALQLPKASSTKSLGNPAVPEQLVLNIRQDGSTVISGKVYPHADEAALAGRIAEAVRKQTNLSVVIRADKRSMVEYFADVARICTQAGVREVKLTYVAASGK